MEYSRRTVLGAAILVSICVFGIFFSFSLFRHLKFAEAKFNKEKAVLVKENMDLQDQLESAKKTAQEKIDAAAALESEKNSMADKIALLEGEKKKLEIQYGEQYNEKLKMLKRENISLRSRVSSIEKMPLVLLIKEAVARENNESVRRVLEDALSKVEMIKTGKAVDLEPIIVAEKGREANASSDKTQSAAPSSSREQVGEIVSIDRSNNLIVVNLGRKDNIREGQSCVIFSDGKEVGWGEVISTRYKLSAVFVGNILYNHTIQDIKEGSKISIRE